MTLFSKTARSRTARALAVVGLVGAAWLSGPAVAPAGAEEPLSEAQQDAVRALVRETLLNDPEIIATALEALQAQRDAQEAAKARAAIKENHDALIDSKATEVLGNPDGDVTIVEFSDYQCGYCKRVFPDLMKAVDADGNIRLVIHELPILGPESVLAARAAIAAEKQDKYGDFHRALMALRGGVSEAAVMQAAAEIGLDVDQLRADMVDPAMDEVFGRNVQLARTLGITGTPAFVIGNELAPGAIPLDRIIEMVAAARSEG